MLGRNLVEGANELVGAVRFELTTSCTRNTRATRLRYAPNSRPRTCLATLPLATVIFVKVEIFPLSWYLERMRMKWVCSLGFASAFLALLIACSTAPVTGRKQLKLVSSDQEMQLGLSEFEKMKQDTPISKDPQANALLQKVGKR